MLIDTKVYASQLKKLWLDVFGDEEGYINLLFDYDYTPAECFAIIENNRVVSALYLLGCFIKTERGILHGRYLYAAATDGEYRGRGYMGKLICEAQEYVKSNNLSFISLVPANESLYGYYSKFGFETLMYNYLCVNEEKGKSCEDKIIIDADEILSLRNNLLTDCFLYEKEDFSYALSCLGYAGYNVYKNSDDSYYIADEDKNEIIEFVTSKENLSDNVQLFLSKLKKGTAFVTCENLSDFCKCKKVPYGMICFGEDIPEDIVRKGVYMNIALD